MTGGRDEQATANLDKPREYKVEERSEKGNKRGEMTQRRSEGMFVVEIDTDGPQWRWISVGA